MKRCPTCDKTFDDNMRFCQTDGTALVDAPEPVDPYKTMVARPEDIAAAIPKMPEAPKPEPKVEEDVLEIPPPAVPDPKKTMYASEAEIRKAMSEVDEQVIEVPPLAEPEPPQFIEPSLGEAPPSPFGGSDQPEMSKTTPPIPSPFENAPPKFEPEPEKAFEPEPPTFSEPESPNFAESERPAAPDFGSPFADGEPSAPIAQSQSTTPSPAAQESNWQDNQMQNPQFQGGAAGAAQNKTLAIVSLVLGILGLLCCTLFLPSLAAVITGFMARGKATSNPSQFGGSGLAIAGIITGAIGVIGGIAYWIFLLFFGGMQMIMQQSNF